MDYRQTRFSQRSWPFWLRLLVALSVVLLVFKVYAGWHWSKRIASGPGITVAVSPTRTMVDWRSVMTLAIIAMESSSTIAGLGLSPTDMWHLRYLIATVVPAGIIAIISYAWITRRFGANGNWETQSRCRRCRYILNGLSEPRCPECGERV